MNESYYVGTYWPGRRESADACARRAERFFRALAQCDPIFTRWFETASSRKQALTHELVPTEQTFQAMFQQKKNQRDGDGFAIAGWNGQGDEASSGFRIFCGGASELTGNSCILGLPSTGAVTERLLAAPVLARVLRSMVLTWEPDWGIATSRMHRDLISQDGSTGTFLGWVTYFSRDRGTVPPLPGPVRTEPVEDKGTLILLTPERLTASNPAHVALALQVGEVLGQAGLLKPVVRVGPGGSTA